MPCVLVQVQGKNEMLETRKNRRHGTVSTVVVDPGPRCQTQKSTDVVEFDAMCPGIGAPKKT